MSNNSDSLSVFKRYNRGLELLRQNNVEEARREFKSILEVDPEYALAFFGIGCVNALQGFADKAVEEWQRAVEIDPGCGEAHYALAWDYYNAEDQEKGYEHVSKAVESGVDLGAVKKIVDIFFYKDRDQKVLSRQFIHKVRLREVIEKKLIFWKKDIIFLLFVILLGVYFGRRLFSSEYLITGYPDWIYHAYRIKSLQSYGFLPWSNDWAGGFPIWQSYQFLPHFVTAGVQFVTGWSITKSMVIISGILFVLLRIFVYMTVRIGGFSPEAGLISSILSFAMIGYQGPIREFSLLWGVTLFPLFFLKVYQLKPGNKSLFIYAILIGSSFYLHPILAIISGIVLCLRLFIDFKWSYKELAFALIICALISSFYWFPLFLGDKPVHVDPWILSSQWQRENMPRQLFGLSFSLVVTGIFVAGSLLKRKLDRWTTFIFSSAIVFIVIISLTYMGYVPKTINLLMPTRWTPFLGLLFSLLAASIIDWFKKFKHFTLLLPVIILIITFEGYIISQSIVPLGTNEIYDVESEWILAHPSDIIYSDRILIESVPDISYFAFGKVRTTGHYFVQGAYELLVSPLKWLFFSEEAGSPIDQRNFDPIESYLKATGTTHVMVSSSKNIAQALLSGGVFEGKLALLDLYQDLAIFQVPWEPIQAFYTDLSNSRNLTFPDISYATSEKHQLRDELVAQFNGIMYGPDSTIASVDFPSQTEVELDIANIEAGQYLIVFIQYDGSWIATVNGEKVPIERNGPNYVGLDISDYRGDLSIHLVHGIHWTWKVGGAITIISFLMGVYVYVSKLRGHELKNPI